jgi:TPR repeat protein
LIADPAYAMELLHQAAAHGNYMPSQVQLGHCYEHGQWVAMDDALSIYWYARAAEQGSPEGCLALSGWYLTGSSGVMLASDREAYLWARRAATSPVQASDPWTVAKAHFAVAIYSERGIGVNDKDKAHRWMSKAAAMGHAGAKQCLKAREAAMKNRREENQDRVAVQHTEESKCLVM